MHLRPHRKLAVQQFILKHGRHLATRRYLQSILQPISLPQQWAVIEDPSKNKLMRWGRRSGKTWCMALYYVLQALSCDESLSIYITLTRKMAKMLLWAELHKLNTQLGLGMTHNSTDLIFTTRNGSRIWLSGAENEAQIDKFRGQKPHLVGYDEAAFFGPHIASMVQEVIEPSLVDNDGTQLMASNANEQCAGHFYDASTNKELGWSEHYSTIYDNTSIPHAAEWIAKKRAQTKMPEDVYQREWLALWVEGKSRRVYHYDPTVNNWDGKSLPSSPAPWEYGLGVDIGYDPDPMAFVVITWNYHHPNAYVVLSESHVGMIPSAAAVYIGQLCRQFSVQKVVADGAGLGKGIVAEWRQKYSLPVHPAKNKHLKKEHIQLLNDDFRTGRVQVKADLTVAHQLQHVQWEDDLKTISDRFPNDETDALEYIWVEAKHFAHKPLEQKLIVGSEEWARREEARHVERAVKEAKARNQQGRPHWSKYNPG